ncbi:MAG: hypothetical protein ACK4V2_03265 [Pseudomonadota bacterium]|jgi:hypothetical protein
MPKFKDLKIAIIIKLIILTLIIIYVRKSHFDLSFNQVIQHITN